MAVSITSIVNEALIMSGSQPITSIDDPTPDADLCRRLYDETRDELLDVHQWNFAQRRATLTRLTATPANQYSYYYVLPADCLHVNEFIGNDQRYEMWTHSVEIADGAPEEVKVLASNATTASIRYTAQITDPSKFSFRFISLLKKSLAIKLGYHKNMDINRLNLLDRQFQRDYQQAMESEVRETQRDTFQEIERQDRDNDDSYNPFISSRW